MNDPIFIDEILQKGREAKDKVRAEFSFITTAQLNWKPYPKSWSIGQCLDHLIISHNFYFPDLQKITEGNYKMSFWERYSPFTAKCGQLLKDRIQEKVGKKMQAPKEINPTSSNISPDIIESYYKSLDGFLAYISNCRSVDIDRTIINSPTIRIVTYSLRDAFQFLLQHEHRHINQATRVRANENFTG